MAVKNKNYIFLFVFFVIFFTACNQQNISSNAPKINSSETINVKELTGKEEIDKKNDSTKTNEQISPYKLVGETYTNNKININYPQINNLSDLEKEKKLNAIIKSEALKALSIYDNDSSVDIDYSVTFTNLKYLSIQYIGSVVVEEGAYPSGIFYTTNIDIHNEKRLTLKDIVAIDDNFIKTLISGRYKPYDSELNVEKESKEELAAFTTKELVNHFIKSDDISDENELSLYSYFTKDSLGISFGLPHALGDHAEYEVKYKDINLQNRSNKIFWNDVTKE